MVDKTPKKKAKVTKKTASRQQANDEQKMDALRERLYSRSSDTSGTSRTKLSNTSTPDVPKEWKTKPATKSSKTKEPATPEPKRAIHTTPYTPSNVKSVSKKIPSPTPSSSGRPITNTPVFQEEAPEVYSEDMSRTKRSRAYRKKILIVGFLFFGVALALSSLFLFFGNNNISGQNISVEISSDAFAIGGGERVDFQVVVANRNAVSIDSATLIVQYPPGTQNPDGSGKELFSERIPLDSIAPSEVRNIPIEAILYGEENDERTIAVSVEYRVSGSNATFYKDAEPLRLKISSSPVALLVDAVRTISSGQETEIELTVGSNSSTPLSNVLVEANYPFGFDYTSSDPAPVSGQNVWQIDTLEPEETTTITLSGVMTGNQSDTRVFTFSVGVASERDAYALSSVYSTVDTEMDIEAPFLGVGVLVNGQRDEIVTINASQDTTIEVRFQNTMDETIYDGAIEVDLSGTAVDEVAVDVPNGFYNSNTGRITWDATDVDSLQEIIPGGSSSVSFYLRPREDIARTPEIQVAVTARGTRVYDDRVPEVLESTASRTIRVASFADLTSGVAHIGGPNPPVVGEESEYTLELAVTNGSNDLTDAEVTAVLPQYVTWLDDVSSGDRVSFNSTTRTMTWDIGDIDAGTSDTATIDVELTPSASQVGQIPTLIETQRLRAEDRFTGSVVRGTASALTTATDGESGRVSAED